MKTNKKWHEKNRMPKNATMRQKAQWHLRHKENCNCRPMPASVMKYIRERKPASRR